MLEDGSIGRDHAAPLDLRVGKGPGVDDLFDIDLLLFGGCDSLLEECTKLLCGFQPHVLEASNDYANFGSGAFGRWNNPSGVPVHHIRGITHRYPLAQADAALQNARSLAGGKTVILPNSPDEGNTR